MFLPPFFSLVFRCIKDIKLLKNDIIILKSFHVIYPILKVSTLLEDFFL